MATVNKGELFPRRRSPSVSGNPDEIGKLWLTGLVASRLGGLTEFHECRPLFAWPNTNVVTVLVVDTGTHNTGSIWAQFQSEVTSKSSRATVIGAGKGFLATWMPLDRVRARAESSPAGRTSAYNGWLRSEGRGRTQGDFLFGVGLQLVNHKVSGIATLILFDSQSLSEGVSHSILPLQVILLHTLIIITLATLSYPSGASLFQLPNHNPQDGVIMFVRLVSQAKHDILPSLKFMGAVG